MEGLEESFLQVGTIATELTLNAWMWAGNFVALIVLTLVLFMLAMRSGGSGLISLNLALYGGYAIYMVFPYRDAIIGIGATPIVQAVLSVILFGIATIAHYSIIVRLTEQSFGSLSILQNFTLSLVAAGFLMALGYHVFDISNIYSFSDPINQLFEPEGYFFYWFIAPLIGLYFLAR